MLSTIFSPNGKVLATAGKDQIIHVWEVGGWRELQRIVGVNTGQFAGELAFFPDSKTVVCAGPDNAIRTWDVTTGKQVRVLAEKVKLSHMALSQMAIWLRLARADSTHSASGICATAWVQAVAQVHHIKGAEYNFYSIAFSPDGKTVAGATA